MDSSTQENEGGRVDPETLTIRFALAAAVNENTLGLGLPRRSVRERFRLTSIAVREILSQILERHGQDEFMRIEPEVRDGMVLAMSVSVENAGASVARDLHALRRYIEESPGRGARLFDCGSDTAGFVHLARQQIAATVSASAKGFRVKYSVAPGGIFVKEILSLPPRGRSRQWQHLVGKTMFRDYDPTSLAEDDLDDVFAGLDRYFGPLQEALQRVSVQPRSQAAEPVAPQEDPWNQAMSAVGLASDKVVCRWEERDSRGEYSEAMIFYDDHHNPIDTKLFCEWECSREQGISRRRTVLDMVAFMREAGDELTMVCVRTSGRDGRRTATLYQRDVRVLETWEKEDLDTVLYLPLYEFFCNYGLPGLASASYSAYGVEIDVTKSAGVCSIMGRWKNGTPEVVRSLKSLRYARSAVIVIDVRYAADVEELTEVLCDVDLRLDAAGRDWRIVANVRDDPSLDTVMRSALAGMKIFQSVDDALREPPASPGIE